MKRLKITYEELFKPTSKTKTEVNISDIAFERLCRRYGIFSIDWYFVDNNTIKYYKCNQWHYTKPYIYV